MQKTAQELSTVVARLGSVKVVRTLDAGTHHEIFVQARDEQTAYATLLNSCVALDSRGKVTLGAQTSRLQAREFVGGWIIADRRAVQS